MRLLKVAVSAVAALLKDWCLEIAKSKFCHLVSFVCVRNGAEAPSV